ncbi:MAG: hypothetical protein R3359_10710 [Marinirhabdus sp.]|nr:hypothetical protein [Marinirhabdus sp.]
MSDVLRRIISFQNKEDSPFSKESDGRIMELTADEGERFTGYYQADDGTFYTEKDWIEHQRQIELERLAEEEYQAEQQRLSAEREARSLKTKALIAIKKRKSQRANSTASLPSKKKSQDYSIAPS